MVMCIARAGFRGTPAAADHRADARGSKSISEETPWS